MTLTSLLIFAVIAVAIWNPRPVRMLLGNRDLGHRPSRSPEQRFVDVIGTAGVGPAKRLGDMALFESTWGFRLIVPALFVVLLVVADGTGSGPVTQGFLLLAALYMMLHVWTMRAVVRDHELHVRTLLFRHKALDLSELTGVEEDQNGNYRLAFSGGKTVYLSKYMTGCAAMRDLLLATLEINRR